jgi:hypothetical protein
MWFWFWFWMLKPGYGIALAKVQHCYTFATVLLGLCFAPSLAAFTPLFPQFHGSRAVLLQPHVAPKAVFAHRELVFEQIPCLGNATGNAL